MRALRGVCWVGALLFWGTAARPVDAAWNNVFQVCCNSCGHSSASSYYGDPCNPCPPQPVCTTRYVQRCYYQPVTCYQTKSYYEPVTTYRTSYYYEPVTSYRYSCYYDPCTCSYQQVACPTTSYRMRTQCCPVQSWVQRCCQVPVTTYRQCNYWEPVTTCCTPAPACCPTGYQAQCPPQQQQQQQPSGQPGPGATEQRQTVMPGATEDKSRDPQYDRYYPYVDPNPKMPPASNGVNRPAPIRLPVTPPAPVPVNNPPKVNLERVVNGPVSRIQGQVVRNDNTPQTGTRVLLVSAAGQGPQQTVLTDRSGRFRATLASGGWYVYVTGNDNQPVFYNKINVRDNETRNITLVSR